MPGWTTWGWHLEAAQDADFEGAPGADSILRTEVKLRNLGGSFFLRCVFETSRPLVLAAGGGESLNQAELEGSSHPQEQAAGGEAGC